MNQVEGKGAIATGSDNLISIVLMGLFLEPIFAVKTTSIKSVALTVGKVFTLFSPMMATPHPC